MAQGHSAWLCLRRDYNSRFPSFSLMLYPNWLSIGIGRLSKIYCPVEILSLFSMHHTSRATISQSWLHLDFLHYHSLQRCSYSSFISNVKWKSRESRTLKRKAAHSTICPQINFLLRWQELCKKPGTN